MISAIRGFARLYMYDAGAVVRIVGILALCVVGYVVYGVVVHVIPERKRELRLEVLLVCAHQCLRHAVSAANRLDKGMSIDTDRLMASYVRCSRLAQLFDRRSDTTADLVMEAYLEELEHFTAVILSRMRTASGDSRPGLPSRISDRDAETAQSLATAGISPSLAGPLCDTPSRDDRSLADIRDSLLTTRETAARTGLAQWPQTLTSRHVDVLRAPVGQAITLSPSAEKHMMTSNLKVLS